MADLESFNELKQKAKVGAGFKGGPMFEKPITHPNMTFVDGYPPEVNEKMQGSKITQGTPTDPWGQRRNK